MEGVLYIGYNMFKIFKILRVKGQEYSIRWEEVKAIHITVPFELEKEVKNGTYTGN